MFKRREGTSGISGHLYESKLISLLYFRASHHTDIEEFQLASNYDGIGAFDDICFKTKVKSKGFDKPILLFIQAKHKDNKKQALTITLSTYFESYLKIRQHFDPSNKDLFFKGTYDEAACFFVLYTTARDEFSKDSKVDSSFRPILNDLINTGGTAKQPYQQDDSENKSLCEEAMKKQMTFLAERIAKFIINNDNFQMILTEKIAQRFHVILAREVVNVSEIKSGVYRVATFRHNFFDTGNKYLTIFKDTLFKEIIKNRKTIESKVKKEIEGEKELIDDFCKEPTNAKKLSELIGTVITYNKGSLEFSKEYLAKCGPEFQQVHVSQLTINQAVQLAAKQILSSPELILRVPPAFGNKDLTLGGNDERKQKRIKLLASFVIDLLLKHNSGNIVTIDEPKILNKLLQLNGGIAGAIGNLFVLDDNPKLMKIADNSESLGPLAKQLYDEIHEEIKSRNNERETNNKISNLSEYKFSFKGDKFPTLLLEYGEYEENKARDFLSKLVIYSNQADETEIEQILKDEIEYNLTLSESLQAKVNSMFLKYHNDIQSWWKLPKEAPYLTKACKFFEKATCFLIDDQIITSISIPYITKTNQYSYTFIEDAVKALNMQNHLSTIIVTKITKLTIDKVKQHLNNTDRELALDLQYIVSLPTNERNVLRRELLKTNNEKVIIIVCDKINDPTKDLTTLIKVTEALQNKQTIIITNFCSLEIIQRCFNKAVTIHDERNSIFDMSQESQTRIFESARVKIKGIEVGLKELFSGWIWQTSGLKRHMVQ